MSCSNASYPTRSFSYVPCTATDASTTCTTDTSQITYNGPALTCSNIATGTTLDIILQGLDEKLCDSGTIDWASFDYSCLTTYTTAQEFVEGISEAYCDLKTSYDAYVISNNAALAVTNSTVSGILNPNLTSCASVGITAPDQIITVLTKLKNATCDLYTQIDVSTANWNSCYTVDPLPITLISGFNTLIAQICGIKEDLDDLSVALPTFNNENTCLSIQGTTDSLYNTVVALRDYACALEAFKADEMVYFGCFGNPSGNPLNAPTLTEILNQLIEYTALAYEKRVIEFDSDYFIVTQYNNSIDPCVGKHVTINPAAINGTDQFVKVNATDTTANYLENKLQAGDNVTLTTITDSYIEIAADNDKVKADSGDTASGYLIEKIEGEADNLNIINIIESYDTVSDKVVLTPIIDTYNMASAVLNSIENNTDLLLRLCALVCECAPCDSTTTTTTTAVREISAIVENQGSDTLDLGFAFSQVSPTVAWFDVSNAEILAGDDITTGTYPITATAPATGTVYLKCNNASGLPMTYNIYMKTSAGASVPGSSSNTGSLNVGDDITINTFTYGSLNDLVLHVDVTST